ncbi:anti-sigma factor [Ruegeria pomeroyi]|uniref:Sigma factor regulator PrtR, putative n=2 Tax=Ruegeria pomeroyi TaxID=89184 RepID=Q5LNS7_RUEPO|nr:anti-sigma factor [Ruegeria pomeroyi]AAV96361.1 sigma factor regulator PrtR, putative [Ruegeria pomeroyi DSS-3]NVK98374.1 anti-sigma factor [Ruegeria pomeroyi]NVL00891.1 anti-sigma factor [Ruegeria pomeroyi]QWV09908.1 anti-sigma factor [Ruegeria pomeroyi]
MTQDPLSDEELIAYFEDALPPAERAALEARLAQDPRAQALLLDWARQNEDIRALYGDMQEDVVPARLRDALCAPRAPLLRQALAASAVLMLGLVVGWAGHARLGDPSPAPALADAALTAHRTFVVEVVHPVEVPASQRDHMNSWMSKRIGAPVSPPDLSASGFALMGGRILPAGKWVAGLYMYENSEGQRITLYVAPQEEGNSTLRFAGDRQTESLHWAKGGLGFVLTGALAREDLRQMATSAYEQLL